MEPKQPTVVFEGHQTVQPTVHRLLLRSKTRHYWAALGNVGARRKRRVGGRVPEHAACKTQAATQATGTMAALELTQGFSSCSLPLPASSKAPSTRTDVFHFYLTKKSRNQASTLIEVAALKQRQKLSNPLNWLISVWTVTPKRRSPQQGFREGFSFTRGQSGGIEQRENQIKIEFSIARSTKRNT